MSLKSFDFFRKLNTDNDTTSIVGGLLTAFAFIVTCTFTPKDNFGARVQRDQTLPQDGDRVLGRHR
jgi:hypothetical protein